MALRSADIAIAARLPEELSHYLDQLVETRVAADRAPGIAVAIANETGRLWSSAVGIADHASDLRSGCDVLYRIASITKVFTATAIVRLRDDGHLRLDDAVTTHLQEFSAVQNPFGPIEEVSIRHLLSHEGGLPVEAPSDDFNTWAGAPMPETMERLGDISLVVPPGTFKYSNLGYALLGQVIERLTATSYDQYFQEEIFTPLGMTSTTLDPYELGDRIRVAQGYDARAFSDDLTPSAPVESGRVGAAGGLWSTVDDLTRWLTFQCGGGEDTPKPVLARPSVLEMQRCTHLMSRESWTDAQGLGWRATRHGDMTFVGHPGGYFGFTAGLVFSPRFKCGAIVLCNGRSDTYGLALELTEVVADARRKMRSDPTTRTFSRRTSHRAPPIAILGAYACEPLGYEVRIEWRDERLVIVDRGAVSGPATDGAAETLVGLEATDAPLTFKILDGDAIGETATFVSDVSGEIELLYMRGAPFTRRFGQSAAAPMDDVSDPVRSD